VTSRSKDNQANDYFHLPPVTDGFSFEAVAALSEADALAARALFSARMNALADSFRLASEEGGLSEREARSILPWGQLLAAHAARRGELSPEDRLLAGST
jgi:hypothetical protein